MYAILKIKETLSFMPRYEVVAFAYERLDAEQAVSLLEQKAMETGEESEWVFEAHHFKPMTTYREKKWIYSHMGVQVPNPEILKIRRIMKVNQDSR